MNLAQLLFATGAGIEARKRLAEAEKLGLGDDGALEAAFYRLAHVNQMTPAAWSTTIYVGDVSGSNSHCFYNV